jgi:hypothetical protein
MEGVAVTTIVLTSGTQWAVPSDWNPGANTFECIGGGGGGCGGSGYAGGTGAAGGAYAKTANAGLTPGSVLYINVGSAGVGGATYHFGTSVANGTPGGDTWVRFDGTSGVPTSTSNGCLAKGGAPGTAN